MPSRHQLANAIRALSMDAVQKANSGHPGMPMGMADIAEVLWNDFLVHDPADPDWPNRDRFILSNGHGSLLHYALLHLTGYQVSIDDLKNFRQLHSKTPGHPEFGDTPGIETTTGPLGQGLANAVGMAIAEQILAAQFNRAGYQLVDHYTYVFVGDGCLMEGISHEVCSLAGTLGLGKLIAFYDDNGISIDGKVDPWFSDNTPQRFLAYGWHVAADVDGHDAQAIKQAIQQARQEGDKPSLICCKTVIGYGAPNLEGSHITHGAPLGEAEIAAARKQLDWEELPFVIPDEIYQAWEARGGITRQAWQEKFAAYQREYTEPAAEFERRLKGDLPDNWQAVTRLLLQQTVAKAQSIASRKASELCLEAYGPVLPELLGGSADLASSNNTVWSGSRAISRAAHDGNYIYYGVREFAMSAIMNGIALHGGFIPYGGTFLVFCDYARNAVRLAAMMKQRVIFVYTHDSIGLGEDGPTHQPIEHIAMLRLTPNMSVWRPCDTVESVVAWQAALERREGPSALLFSRQTLPYQVRDEQALNHIARGAYILRDCAECPELIIIATGSEVDLAVKAYEALQQQGKQVRVISMPSVDVFEAQTQAYQDSVLPPQVQARIAVEAAAADYWYKYVGLHGRIIGLNRYGASAPGPAVLQSLGITVERIIEAAKALSGADYLVKDFKGK